MKKLIVATLLITSLQVTTIFANPTAGVVYELNSAKYGSAGVTKELSSQISKAKTKQKKQEEKARKAEEKKLKLFEKAKANITTKWTKTVVNVRQDATTKSEVLIVLDYNTQVEGFEFDGWFYLTKTDGCIRADLLNDEEFTYRDIAAPWNSGWKSWMPYTTITATGSKQYYLQYNYAYTGNYGIRQVNGRYCVALGSYFGVSIGQYFDLILENGTIIPCIMADAKADRDTDYLNATSRNGCMSEFIIDRWALDSRARSAGTIGAVDDNWKSPISIVRVYDENILK